jgi:putative Holliday junction resolvase
MKIMSVDFGDARTGIAMCDKTEFLASPITVIHEKRFEHAIEKTAEEVGKENALFLLKNVTTKECSVIY